MIISTYVIVSWNGNNKDYYESKGYNFTKFFDKFEVKIEDVHPCCKKIVKCKCDICGKEFERIYCNVNKIISVCSDKQCIKLQRQKLCQLRYGENITNPSQLESVRNKKRNAYNNKTEQEKLQIKQKKQNAYNNKTEQEKMQFKQKIKDGHARRTPEEKAMAVLKGKQTYFQRTGYEHNMHNPESKIRFMKTNIEKRGTPWPTMSPDVKDKVKNTNIEKYGCENQFQRNTVKQTIQKHKNEIISMYGVMTSKIQIYYNDLFHGELNFHVGKYKLDIAFPNKKIYLEIDGVGHFAWQRIHDADENITKQKYEQRYNFLQNQGWKMIRWINKEKKDNFPHNELALMILQRCIEQLNANDYICVDFDNQNVYSENRNVSLDLFISGGDNI